MDTLFIEKYKPKTLDDVIGNQKIINNFKLSQEKHIFSHVIIYGKTGLGKTTTAKIYAKEISNNDFIEYSAYDDRNQNNIKTKLDIFTQKKYIEGDNTPRVVLFDEFDTVLDSTQSVIFEYLEKTSVVFIFTVNNIDSIIEAIQKKCLIYNFKSVSKSEIYCHLEKICKQENITYTEEGLNSIIFSSNGDVRVAINNLHLTYIGFKEINNDSVFKICNIPEIELLVILVENLKKKNLYKTILLTKKFLKMGYNPSDIIINLFNIVKNYDIEEEFKISFLSKINKTLYHLSTFIFSDLQLYQLFADIIKENNF
jgi:replication factor C subunit 2/4